MALKLAPRPALCLACHMPTSLVCSRCGLAYFCCTEHAASEDHSDRCGDYVKVLPLPSLEQQQEQTNDRLRTDGWFSLQELSARPLPVSFRANQQSGVHTFAIDSDIASNLGNLS